MYGLLNLGSIILGVIALELPIVSFGMKKEEYKKLIILVTSISACAISLCMQIFYTNYLVRKEDWSALMDTNGAVTWVSALLLIITVVLNIIAIRKYRTER